MEHVKHDSKVTCEAGLYKIVTSAWQLHSLTQGNANCSDIKTCEQSSMWVNHLETLQTELGSPLDDCNTLSATWLGCSRPTPLESYDGGVCWKMHRASLSLCAHHPVCLCTKTDGYDITGQQDFRGALWNIHSLAKALPGAMWLHRTPQFRSLWNWDDKFYFF